MECENSDAQCYLRFLDKFISNIRPDDPLPVRAPSYKVTDFEIDGQIIDIVHHYLNRECPPYLRGVVAHRVWQAIRDNQQNGHDSEDMVDSGSHSYNGMELVQNVTTEANNVLKELRSSITLEEALTYPQYLPVSSFAIKNTRRKMEDRYVIIRDMNATYNLDIGQPHALYAVFDGHGGCNAAEYAAAHLPQSLIQNPLYLYNPDDALKHAFFITDTNFDKKAKTERLKGGTTAVVALVREKRLVVAWLGDSQATLVRKRKAVPIVEPHKPEAPKEKQRIENAGGVVLNIRGTWRVLGQLAVSRAIGDVEYKPYVTSECDIKSLDIEGDEDFLILACDGLWDTLTPDMAVNIVYAYLTKNDADTNGVGKCLVETARGLGSEDNITAVVVFLRPVATLMEEEASRIAKGEVPANNFSELGWMKDSPPATIGAIFSPHNDHENGGQGPGGLYNNPFSPPDNKPLFTLSASDPPIPAPTTELDLEEGLPVTSDLQDDLQQASPDEGVAVDDEPPRVDDDGDQFMEHKAVHDASTPTAEEVDAALAVFDSIPDGTCEADVEEDDEEEDEWAYYHMEPQSQPQGDDVIAPVSSETTEKEGTEITIPSAEETTDLLNGDSNSLQNSSSPAPGSPRSVEGFVTSVELNTAEEGFNTNLAINQTSDLPIEGSSGPFSVYVSTSPEPVSMEPVSLNPLNTLDIPNPPSPDVDSPMSPEVDVPMGIASPASPDIDVPITDVSGVEIVHAQSTVEVVDPPSPIPVESSFNVNAAEFIPSGNIEIMSGHKSPDPFVNDVIPDQKSPDPFSAADMVTTEQDQVVVPSPVADDLPEPQNTITNDFLNSEMPVAENLTPTLLEGHSTFIENVTPEVPDQKEAISPVPVEIANNQPADFDQLIAEDTKPVDVGQLIAEDIKTVEDVPEMATDVIMASPPPPMEQEVPVSDLLSPEVPPTDVIEPPTMMDISPPVVQDEPAPVDVQNTFNNIEPQHTMPILEPEVQSPVLSDTKSPADLSSPLSPVENNPLMNDLMTGSITGEAMFNAAFNPDFVSVSNGIKEEEIREPYEFTVLESELKAESPARIYITDQSPIEEKGLIPDLIQTNNENGDLLNEMHNNETSTNINNINDTPTQVTTNGIHTDSDVSPTEEVLKLNAANELASAAVETNGIAKSEPEVISPDVIPEKVETKTKKTAEKTPAKTPITKKPATKPTSAKTTTTRTPITKTPTDKTAAKKTVDDKKLSRPGVKSTTPTQRTITTKPAPTRTAPKSTTGTTTARVPPATKTATKPTPRPTSTLTKTSRPSSTATAAKSTTQDAQAKTAAKRPLSSTTKSTTTTRPAASKPLSSTDGPAKRLATTAPRRPLDKPTGAKVESTRTVSRTTTTSSRPASSTKPSTTKPLLKNRPATAEKDAKNTTNKILSTTRSTLSTKSSAAKSSTTTTTKTNTARTTTTRPTKPGDAPTAKTRTTLKSSLDAKKTTRTVPAAKKTGDKKAAAAVATNHVAEQENKIVEEESSVEVKEKLTQEEVITDNEKLLSNTIEKLTINDQLESNEAVKTTNEIMVNGSAH